MSIDLFSSLIQNKDRILAQNIILMLGDPTIVPTFDALVLSDLLLLCFSMLPYSQCGGCLCLSICSHMMLYSAKGLHSSIPTQNFWSQKMVSAYQHMQDKLLAYLL